MDRCRWCDCTLNERNPRRKPGVRECRQCFNAYRREYRKRRREAGSPLPPGGRMPREYHQEYEAEYREREGVRERMAATARVRRKNPGERKKATTRRVARAAVARGELVRGPCEVCGITIGVQGHHDDYDIPLDVRWLCPPHHSREHYPKAEDGG